MPNVSVTNLDLYRFWRDSEDLELDWLLRRLRGEEPQTEAMLAGEALHDALEKAEEGDTAILTSGDFTFHFLCPVTLGLPTARELSFEKQYGDLLVKGRVDALEGRTVFDYKSTEQFDADRLLESYQWRFYLDMADCDTFKWKVFVMDEKKMPREYEIYQAHELSQHRYEGLAADCERLANDFHRFTEYLALAGKQWQRVEEVRQ